MGNQTKPKGKRFEPLKKDQIRKFDEASQVATNTLTELTGRTLLHTGLRNGAFCHLRPWWLADDRMMGKVMLRVPDEEECIGGVGAVGKGNPNGVNLSDRGQPCHKCRNKRQGQWGPKTSNSPRPLPIMEEVVYESLKDWFSHHTQIPLLHAAVAGRVEQVANEAGLEREVLPHDLRHTYGTMLARMGVDAPVIATVMGHGSLNMAMKYIKFVGRDVMREFKDKWDFESIV